MQEVMREGEGVKLVMQVAKVFVASTSTGVEPLHCASRRQKPKMKTVRAEEAPSPKPQPPDDLLMKMKRVEEPLRH